VGGGARPRRFKWPETSLRFQRQSGFLESAFVVFDCLNSFPARSGLSDIQSSFPCSIFLAGIETWYGRIATLLPKATPLSDTLLVFDAQQMSVRHVELGL